MKNLMILVMAISAIFFASSCSKPQPISFTEFSKKGDTVIALVVYHPDLKNRTGCNDTLIPTQFVNGRPILQEVTGWKPDTMHLPVSVNVKVTEADMRAHTKIGTNGPVDGSDGSSGNSLSPKGNGFWNGFWNGFGICGIIPWLLITALVVFLAWLLSLLPWFRDRNVTHSHVHTHNYPQPPVPPVAKPEEDDKKVSVPEYLKLTSDKKSETEEKTELKFRSGIPMDVLLAGMKNRNEGGIQVIAYNPGDGNITINVNGKEPVSPVPPVTP